MTSLLHERWRKRVSLLASGALAGPEREAVLAHLAGCASCRGEQAQLQAVLSALAADPLRVGLPPVSAAALRARVEARLDSAGAPAARGRLLWTGPSLLRALAAAAVVALALLAPRRGPAPAVRVAVPEAPSVPPDLLARMEGTVARDQAIRYLNAAQDVLVNVASRPRDCDRGGGRVDVSQEAERSRELLVRRRLLLEMDRGAVVSARPVLEDVERVLREVASLQSCARARDLDAIHRQIRDRRLLMKIDLMTRELQG